MLEEDGFGLGACLNSRFLKMDSEKNNRLSIFASDLYRFIGIGIGIN